MKLPTIEDFTSDPDHDLDGAYAWRQFGGLTLDEAYEKFCESPDTCQEDFMFMGDGAFTYYFPVIDRYIRQNEPGEEYDRVAYILARGISQHVSLKQVLVRPLYRHIIDLCHFVIDGLKSVDDKKYRDWSVEQVEHVWLELLNKTSGLLNSSDSE